MALNKDAHIRCCILILKFETYAAEFKGSWGAFDESIQTINSSVSSIDEMEKAIKSMKYDQVTTEMLKADSRLSAQSLHPIFLRRNSNSQKTDFLV